MAYQPSLSVAGSSLSPLSRPQLAEARRVRAVELFEDGVSNAEIARAVGVCAESVRRWRRVWEQGGASALRRQAATGRKKQEAVDETGKEEIPVADQSKNLKWFGARTVYYHNDLKTYEERVTMVQAGTFQNAVEQATDEAREYCEIVENADYLDFVQVYEMTMDKPESGSEVFSLMRDSDLGAQDYLSSFFDTGRERQHDAE
ncbi:helix-turn-helix domain-containing protein [Streptomyces sp. NPDC094034]|uniref:helix-turn-helix domain-containing protein n=1 Tax=Streptomyces sp. NPDC094034 TaxID=3155309 RepID=UPI00331CF958